MFVGADFKSAHDVIMAKLVRSEWSADSKGCTEVSVKVFPCVSKIRKEKQ